MRKQGRLYQDASEVAPMLAELASWWRNSPVNHAVGRTHSCSDRMNQSIKQSTLLRSNWSKGSLNDLLGHQKQANTPPADGCSTALLRWNGSLKWSALSKGTKCTQSKWIALNIGLTLQDLVQAKEGPTQTHPSRFGLANQESQIGDR